MGNRLVLLAGVFALALAAPLAAQTGVDAKSTGTGSAPGTSDAGGSASSERATKPRASSGSAAGARPFVPSRRLSAGRPVSFPVDI